MLLKKMHKKYFNFRGTRCSPMTPYLKEMNKRSHQKDVREPYFKGRVKEKVSFKGRGRRGNLRFPYSGRDFSASGTSFGGLDPAP